MQEDALILRFYRPQPHPGIISLFRTSVVSHQKILYLEINKNEPYAHLPPQGCSRSELCAPEFEVCLPDPKTNNAVKKAADAGESREVGLVD